MGDRTPERPLDKLFRYFFFLGFATFALVLGAYFLQFRGHGISQSTRDWAEFGEYLGGTLGGVFGFYAFVGVLITIVRQNVDSERQIRATLDAVTRAHSINLQSQRKSMLAVAEAAFDRAEKMREAIKTEDNRLSLYSVYHKSVIEGMVEALNRLPLHEIGSGAAVISMLALRDQYIFLGRSLEEYIAGPFRNPDLKQAIEAYSGAALREKRTETINYANSILQNNVIIRLDEIAANFKILALELKTVC